MCSRISLIFLLAIILAGCATKMVAPPAEDLRANLTNLGLVGTSEQPVIPPKEPIKGSGDAALTGAGQGAAGTFFGIGGPFCQGGGPAICVVGVILGAAMAPVGVVVGAGVGASRSHSAEEVESAQKTTIDIISQLHPNRELTDRAQELAIRKYGTQIIPVDCWVATFRCKAKGSPAPKFVLYLGYYDFSIKRYGKIDPDLGITATVFAKFFRLSDEQHVYERTWGYQSTRENYFALTKNAGNGLVELIKQSHEKIASRVIRDLFETSEASPIGSPKPDTIWNISGPFVDNVESKQEPSWSDKPD